MNLLFILWSYALTWENYNVKISVSHFVFVGTLVALGKYQTASESGSENEELSHVRNVEETLEHILIHEKSAAGIWCQLKHHHGTQASHLPLMKDVVGIVSMLGNVDDDNLSRLILCQFLYFLVFLAIIYLHYSFCLAKLQFFPVFFCHVLKII